MILLSISIVFLSIAVIIVNYKVESFRHKLNLLKDRIIRVEEDSDSIIVLHGERIKKLENKVFPIK